MASALDVVNEWASDSEEKQHLVKTHTGLVVRWLNGSQLRYADKSEMLRSTWSPTVTSTGNIAIPTDFLREFPDLVQKTSGTTGESPLIKVDYTIAKLRTWSGLVAYSIYDGTFYVWSAQACTPVITYIQKPTDLTATTYLTTALEIPTEYHYNLIQYLEAKWLYRKKEIDYSQYNLMMKDFENQAKNDGYKFRVRNDGLIVMRNGGF